MATRLKPLQEFVCDHCNSIVQNTMDDGWLEWLQDDEGKAHSFRLVHRHSRCQKHSHSGACMDNHLPEFVGPAGLWHVLWMITPDLRTDGTRLPGATVRDAYEWVTLFKRLQVPGYEQARLFLAGAVEDGIIEAHLERDTAPEMIEAILSRYVDGAA